MTEKEKAVGNGAMSVCHAPEVDMGILRDLPYPIARLYVEMSVETDACRKFRSVVRAFVGFLKYTSLIAISEYLQSPHPGEREIDELLAGDKLARPSLGHWIGFLREILAFHRRSGLEPRVRGLVEFYYDSAKTKPTSTQNARRIDAFVHLRNEYIHPDIEPEIGVAERLCRQFIPELDALLEEAGFLREYPLHYATETELIVCSGPEFAQFTRRRMEPGLTANDFYLFPSSGPLSLLTFLLCGCPDNASPANLQSGKPPSDILLYEGKKGKLVKFLRGNFFSFMDLPRFASTEGILTELKNRLGQNEKVAQELFRNENVLRPEWGRLSEYTQKSSENIVRFHEFEGKYHRAFYLPRQGIEKHYWQFIDAPETIAIFVGDSGCGKTNLFCHLTEETQGKGHSVLHFYGRNFPGGDFRRVVAAELVVEEGQLIPYLKAIQNSAEVQGGKRLVLFVDAINEYSDPGELYREIDKLAETLAGEAVTFCKLVVSMRTATWRRLENSLGSWKGRVYCTKGDEEEGVQPFVRIGPFSKEETRNAYELYRSKDKEDSLKERARKKLGYTLETSFDQLPISVRRLVANPIFLKMLAKSKAQVDKDLTAGDVLLNYYVATVPEKHRYCLHYVVESMWERRTDCLDEDTILEARSLQNLPESDYRKKLLEYYTEDPVSVTSTVYYCFNDHCFLSGETICGEAGEERRCVNCNSLMRERSEALCSTFCFLVDEGILSTYSTSGGDEGKTLIRFTYDRLFEMMMARHMLTKLQILSTSNERAGVLLGWLTETSDRPIFDDVFVNLLVLLFDKAAIPDKKDERGILVDLEKREADPGVYLHLVQELLRDGSARVSIIIRRALVQIGLNPAVRKHIEEVLLELCHEAGDRSASPAARIGTARVALEAARELVFFEPLLVGAENPDSNIRMLATCQSYFLWKGDAEVGLRLLRQAFDRLFLPFAIPKPRMLEFVIGTSVIILLGHPRESKSIAQILTLMRGVVNRAGWWLRLAMTFLPRFVEKVLRDVPSDYNPVNLTEIRLAVMQFAKDADLRAVALEYVGLLRSGEMRRDRQKELVLEIQKRWPRNELMMVLHQLCQGHASHGNIDETVALELSYVEQTAREGVVWGGAAIYDVCWLNSGDRKMSEESYKNTIRAWEHLISTRSFSYKCMSENKYYIWSVSGIGLLMAEREGDVCPPRLRHLADSLLETKDADGLYAFFRGLDILGPELGTAKPMATRVTIALVEHILTTHPDLADEYLMSIARTLHRLSVLFPENVELLMESLGDSACRRRLKEKMGAMEFKENIGVWASQRGQEFYLYAMGIPYWRGFFADLFENLIAAKSFSTSLRYALRLLIAELRRSDYRLDRDTEQAMSSKKGL